MRDTTAKKNLLLLIQLRWLAVIGQVITILTVHYGFRIDLPLSQMLAVVLFLVFLNFTSSIRCRQKKGLSNSILFIEILLDVSALTVQLYLSGGASNPFISLYLLQVILGTILLETWAVWLLVAITSFGFIGLTVQYRKIELPHAHGTDFFNLHIQGMFFCFLLTAVLLVFFVTRIQKNLAARDAYWADLRQQAVEEDHIVRMGLLASGAAHELGTPLATLSVILGDWQRMAVFQNDPEIATELTEMQTQLNRCKTIVSGILISSGDARGEGTLRVGIVTFLNDMVREWQKTRQPAVVDYRCTFAPDQIVVSDAALKQVIFNLLDNALEASPTWVGIRVAGDAEMVTITVTDRGTGFSADMLADFGKPYRSSKQQPGSGLGLFLVLNVVRKLGGTVRAGNREDGGAEVELRLPLSALLARKTDAP
ncbi:ATP-binding protein [Elstera sp.]|uniref:ATP-binding protein n=1 Tax=Elstera sp. TaxID=1916664 RepID=UPI0037BFC4F9